MTAAEVPYFFAFIAALVMAHIANFNDEQGVATFAMVAAFVIACVGL